jgi:hypothetical protein
VLNVKKVDYKCTNIITKVKFIIDKVILLVIF